MIEIVGAMNLRKMSIMWFNALARFYGDRIVEIQLLCTYWNRNQVASINNRIVLKVQAKSYYTAILTISQLSNDFLVLKIV